MCFYIIILSQSDLLGYHPQTIRGSAYHPIISLTGFCRSLFCWLCLFLATTVLPPALLLPALTDTMVMLVMLSRGQFQPKRSVSSAICGTQILEIQAHLCIIYSEIKLKANPTLYGSLTIKRKYPQPQHWERGKIQWVECPRSIKLTGLLFIIPIKSTALFS